MSNEKVTIKWGSWVKFDLTPVEDEPGVYEYATDDGLHFPQLRAANLQGYIYLREVRDVDYEDADEDGKPVVKRCDIFFFKKIA